MDINQLISSAITGQLASAVSNKLDVPGNKSKSVIDLAIPLLVGGLARNSTDTKEAKNISQALSEDHDGSILENISASLQENSTEDNGMKILDHILGNKQTVAAQAISKQTNVDPGQVQQILALVAPVVMGALGKQQKESDLDVSDLSSLLQNSAKQNERSAPAESGLISRILDQDKDGSFIDDLINFFKKIFR